MFFTKATLLKEFVKEWQFVAHFNTLMVQYTTP